MRSDVLWSPSEEFVRNSNLTKFREWLAARSLTFEAYEAFWQWSIENPAIFWTCIWEYFEVISSSDIRQTLQGAMPDTRWFERSTLNYAEHIFRNSTDVHPAIIFASERHEPTSISWTALSDQVSCLQRFLLQYGIEKGDRVAGFLPNIPEATVSMLATISVGAIWSSCSPDFGVESVVDRLSQTTPEVLICTDGYQYGGKAFDKLDVIREILQKVPSIRKVILIPYLNPERSANASSDYTLWTDLMQHEPGPLEYIRVPFDHPIWILFSSGTTGLPKGITHGHGGMLLEHLKYLAFHNDVHRGEKFFWFTTTGWMMWNFVQAALLHGATIVLYDGSPAYPDLSVLWRLASETGLQHFGTSAPFLTACMQKQLHPNEVCDLSSIRSVSSTGAPLPSEAFDWVYQAIHQDVWLCSMSGGTDVCTAFVGGCPEKPVYRGEIQCRALGCAMFAFNEEGEKVTDEVGEMVITVPMPCMPVAFWNDPNKERYTQSYFSEYPGVWRHGDWVKITQEGGVVISGRSDTTLNRQGIRIGTAEIYRALLPIPEIEDSLVVHVDHGGRDFMPLFVVLQKGMALTHDLEQRIRNTLREKCSPRHVPDKIFSIPAVPYTISGKKMEAPVKKILSGMSIDKVASRDAMRNPEALDYFSSLSVD